MNHGGQPNRTILRQQDQTTPGAALVGPAAARYQGVEEEEDDAGDDGGVGQVEGGPVPAGVVDVEEIDDVAEEDAVDEGADGAAQQQGGGAGQDAGGLRQGAPPEGRARAEGGGEDGHKRALQ